jgi:hypothetical protein
MTTRTERDKVERLKKRIDHLEDSLTSRVNNGYRPHNEADILIIHRQFDKFRESMRWAKRHTEESDKK